VYADNMQGENSGLNGASTVNPSGNTIVGGFTTLARVVSTLATTGYVQQHGHLYTYTVTGL
jgi:hypothetical protein